MRKTEKTVLEKNTPLVIVETVNKRSRGIRNGLDHNTKLTIVLLSETKEEQLFQEFAEKLKMEGNKK